MVSRIAGAREIRVRLQAVGGYIIIGNNASFGGVLSVFYLGVR